MSCGVPAYFNFLYFVEIMVKIFEYSGLWLYTAWFVPCAWTFYIQLLEDLGNTVKRHREMEARKVLASFILLERKRIQL